MSEEQFVVGAGDKATAQRYANFLEEKVRDGGVVGESSNTDVLQEVSYGNAVRRSHMFQLDILVSEDGTTPTGLSMRWDSNPYDDTSVVGIIKRNSSVVPISAPDKWTYHSNSKDYYFFINLSEKKVECYTSRHPNSEVVVTPFEYGIRVSSEATIREYSIDGAGDSEFNGIYNDFSGFLRDYYDNTTNPGSTWRPCLTKNGDVYYLAHSDISAKEGCSFDCVLGRSPAPTMTYKEYESSDLSSNEYTVYWNKACPELDGTYFVNPSVIYTEDDNLLYLGTWSRTADLLPASSMQDNRVDTGVSFDPLVYDDVADSYSYDNEPVVGNFIYGFNPKSGEIRYPYKNSIGRSVLDVNNTCLSGSFYANVNTAKARKFSVYGGTLLALHGVSVYFTSRLLRTSGAYKESLTNGEIAYYEALIKKNLREYNSLLDDACSTISCIIHDCEPSTNIEDCYKELKKDGSLYKTMQNICNTMVDMRSSMGSETSVEWNTLCDYMAVKRIEINDLSNEKIELQNKILEETDPSEISKLREKITSIEKQIHTYEESILCKKDSYESIVSSIRNRVSSAENTMVKNYSNKVSALYDAFSKRDTASLDWKDYAKYPLKNLCSFTERLNKLESVTGTLCKAYVSLYGVEKLDNWQFVSTDDPLQSYFYENTDCYAYAKHIATFVKDFVSVSMGTYSVDSFPYMLIHSYTRNGNVRVYNSGGCEEYLKDDDSLRALSIGNGNFLGNYGKTYTE